MASDELIKERLMVLLKDSDLSTTTEKMLRKKLEQELGEDLSSKKELIRGEVTAFLAEQEGEGEEDAEEEEGEEEGGSKKKRGGGGFGKDCCLSEEMQAFLGGVRKMSRSQVVKKIWEYIKANDLQNPSDKRQIIVDDKLGTIFTPPINMFSMNKQLSRHCKPADAVANDSDGEAPSRPSSSRSASKKKTPSKKRAAPGGDGGAKKKPRGMYGANKVSEALAAATGKTEMTRSEVTKWFWAYVKEKGLQDPADKSFIICDDTLKGLVGEARFKGFGCQKYLKVHILGPADDDAAGGGEEAAAEEDEEEQADGGSDGGGDENGVKEEGAEEESAAVAAAAAVKEEDAAEEAAIKEEAAAEVAAEEAAAAAAEAPEGVKQEGDLKMEEAAAAGEPAAAPAPADA